MSNTSLTVEEISYTATVLDNATYKTRRAVIENMKLCLPGDIVSPDEREFVRHCVDKLEAMTDYDFGNIKYLSAWNIRGEA